MTNPVHSGNWLPLNYAGGTPPDIPKREVPGHVAIIMDGNGRWAESRGLPRTEGHRAGEGALLDVVAGAIQAGVRTLSVYAFSTENWKRSPQEVRFLMGFNRDVLHRRRDQLDAWGVRIRWVGRRPRLWRSVIKDLRIAEAQTRQNTVLTLNMCINYGGRAELVDAARSLAEDVAAGRIHPAGITERSFAARLGTHPDDTIDLVIRSSGEQRLSNFMLWQAAYAEFVFQRVLWPDYRREHLWQAIEEFRHRNRRFGAVPGA
ncbi:MAG: isoprenyl transferase [Microbacteriaceae bacterium]|jgi:undecaprenyl diphosphate synthase|nr:isoprenyl transferase [Microbacteriaceae bacterium]